MRALSAYLIGLLFGAGIVISGMGNPAKVINFFDIAGAWDPSLVFVMGGALVTTLLGYRFVLAQPAPLFDGGFNLPTKDNIDERLIGGAAVFGVGWGIAGFCPGGALPMLGTGDLRVLLFVSACVSGIFLSRALTAALKPTATKETRV